MLDEIELIKKVELLAKMGLSYQTSFDKIYAHNTDTAVMCLSRDNREFQFQQGFFNFFGIGDQINEENFDYRYIKKLIFDKVLNFEEAYQIYADSLLELEQGNIQHISMENIYYNKDSLLRCIDCSFFNVTFKGEPYMLVIVSDNTNHIEDKLVLNEMSSDKDVLLKEVHHRVKNNLQILASLIRLQERFGIDYKEIVNSMQLSISSMALIHEKMYSDKHFGDILASSFFESFKKNVTDLYGSTGIEFTFDMEEDLYLSGNTITPLLLIANELIINSIKYAFPDGFEGEKKIYVQLKTEPRDGDNIGVLVYHDTGVGLSKEEQKNRGSLGTMLLESLISQIDGKYETLGDEGFSFKIEFPIENFIVHREENKELKDIVTESINKNK